MLGTFTIDIQLDIGLVLVQLATIIALAFVHRSSACQLRKRKR